MEQRYIAGDWVKHRGKLARIEETYRTNYFVKECHDDYNPDIEYDDAYFFREVRPQDLVSIPLTCEILEESGWKKGMYSSSKGQYTILAKDFDDNVSRIAVVFFKQVIKAEVWHRGYHLGIYLSYVHQLQHLLFGLGLDFDFNLENSKKGGEK